MNAVASLSNEVGVRAACCALVIPRASFYRWKKPKEKSTKPTPPLALTEKEREEVLSILHEERFIDKAPQEIYASLPDEAAYLYSIRTMYRILDEEGEVQERRKQINHPHYAKPELLATGPNQVWSWDITKLRGPVKWTYYYLYVILDIFSRYVVGWMVAERELAALARKLIAETCKKQGIEPGQLSIHADRGSEHEIKAGGIAPCGSGRDKESFTAFGEQ